MMETALSSQHPRWPCRVLHFFIHSFYQYYFIASFFFFKREALGIGRVRMFVHILLIELKFRLRGTFSGSLGS